MYQIFNLYDNKDSFVSNGFLVVKTMAHQSMCSEFETNPSFPEINVYHFTDPEKGGKLIENTEMKTFYNMVQGKEDRIAFWLIVQHIHEIQECIKNS